LSEWRRSQIESVQAQFGIVFPSAYVDFLLTMGDERGSLRPFGETQVHAFSELVTELHPRTTRCGGSYKVAFEAQEYPIAIFDTYLDFTRSDGHERAVGDVRNTV